MTEKQIIEFAQHYISFIFSNLKQPKQTLFTFLINKKPVTIYYSKPRKHWRLLYGRKELPI